MKMVAPKYDQITNVQCRLVGLAKRKIVYQIIYDLKDDFELNEHFLETLKQETDSVSKMVGMKENERCLTVFKIYGHELW